MDAGDSLPDATDHPIQDLQRIELGGNSNVDGTEVYSGQCEDGISEIYERNLMFVTNVTHVTFQNAIVYAERSE